MKNIVYGLLDSRNDLVYYVGKSSVGDTRALSHLTKSHSKKVNDWIEKVHYNYGYVKVIVIEEVDDINFLAQKEVYWISYYKSLNPKLLNVKSTDKCLNDFYTEEDYTIFNNLKHSALFCGDIIKKERLFRSLTQNDLAKLSNINRWTISQIENGKDISLLSLKKIMLGFASQSIKSSFKKNINKERVSISKK